MRTNGKLRAGTRLFNARNTIEPLVFLCFHMRINCGSLIFHRPFQYPALKVHRLRRYGNLFSHRMSIRRIRARSFSGNRRVARPSHFPS